MFARTCLTAILTLLVFSLSFLGSISEAVPVKYPIFPKVDTCAKSCTINADCGIGGKCTNKTCQYENQYCANDRWSMNARGEASDCKAYTCNTQNGLCRRQAQESEHCSPGYAYDGDKSCVLSIQCDPATDPGCQPLIDKWKKTREQWESTFPQPVSKIFSCVKCNSHNDCKSSEMCWQNRCVADSPYCDKNGATEEASFFRSGLIQACQNYTCEKVSGLCLNDCLQNSDCTNGMTCDPKDNRCKNPAITP